MLRCRVETGKTEMFPTFPTSPGPTFTSRSDAQSMIFLPSLRCLLTAWTRALTCRLEHVH